ncbi:MAG: hypothetical protein KDA57_02355 [Planctomycetales bacterium]|nr:hypothetical protein [Planctomycetales bacterium]
MNGLYRAALEIQKFCQDRQWKFCFIGGLALVRWGEVRQTQDADLCLLTGFENEAAYVTELLKHFKSRVDDAYDFSVASRVVLLFASDGVPLDISLAGRSYEERMIRRSSDFQYLPGVVLKTASAEDLIVLKAFAGRTRDWADIEGILIRQSDALDWEQIMEELVPLCELKESPETTDRLKKLRHDLDAE